MQCHLRNIQPPDQQDEKGSLQMPFVNNLTSLKEVKFGHFRKTLFKHHQFNSSHESVTYAVLKIQNCSHLKRIYLSFSSVQEHSIAAWEKILWGKQGIWNIMPILCNRMEADELNSRYLKQACNDKKRKQVSGQFYFYMALQELHLCWHKSLALMWPCVFCDSRKTLPCKLLIMQKRKRMVSDIGPKSRKPRPHVVPNRQERPQILRKATWIFFQSGRLWISLTTRKSMTTPELTTTASKPSFMM